MALNCSPFGNQNMLSDVIVSEKEEKYNPFDSKTFHIKDISVNARRDAFPKFPFETTSLNQEEHVVSLCSSFPSRATHVLLTKFAFHG